MAIVKIVQGDINIKEMLPTYNLVEIADKAQFTVAPFDGVFTPKVIDAMVINDSDFIRWAIENTAYPLVVLFADGKIPFRKLTFETENKVELLKGKIKEKIDAFGIVNKVLYSDNRVEVYDILKSNSSSHYFVYCSLVSNIDKLNSNRNVLEFIDMNAFLKDTERFCSLLAFSFKPISIHFKPQWKFPKKD